MSRLTVDTPAVFDTFAGLIPVTIEKITGVSGFASTAQNVDFKIAKDHGPYKKGEEFTRSALWIVPTSALRRRHYGTTIGSYFVECQT